MNKGLYFSTVKKAYVLLNEYFRTMYLEEMISKNPMDNVEMIKKANFLSAQGKELLPECEMVTVFSPDEIQKFRKKPTLHTQTESENIIKLPHTY